MLVFSRWSAPDGSKYCAVDLVYQTVDQLRSAGLLDLEQHPAIVPMRFASIETNADGLYAEKDFMDLLGRTIEAYDDVMDAYDIPKAA